MKQVSPCLFFTLNSSGESYRITYISHNVETLTGVSAVEICENFTSFWDLVHDDDKIHFNNEIEISKRTLEPLNDFLRIRIGTEFVYSEVRLSVRENTGDIISWDGIIMDILTQKKFVPELSRHLDFEMLVSSISTEFTGLSTDDIDNGILRALEQIGPFSGSDRSYVCLLKEQDETIDEFFEWSKEGVDPLNDQNTGEYSIKQMAWFAKHIRNLEVVYIPDQAMLPEYALEEKKHLETHKIKSTLIVPMASKGVLFGFLGFEAINEKQRWTMNDQMLLRLCGEVFVHALIRKRSERVIFRTNRLFEEVIKQSPIPIGVVDPDGNIMIFNRACAEQLGIDFETYTNQDLNMLTIKKPWKEYDLSGNIIPNSELPISKALEGIQTVNKESLVVRSDGTKRWQIFTGGPIFDQKGELIAAFTIFPDITKLMQVETELRIRVRELIQSKKALSESEAKFRSYIETSPEGIFVTDEQGCYLEVNNALCKMTGYSEIELLNLSVENISYKEDLKEVIDSIRECLEQGHSSVDLRFIAKDGDIRFGSVDSVTISENRVLGFIKDMTENKRMLEKLRQMEKMDAIGQLAGGIAHDFNNQIAVIMGYSEILVSNLKDERLLKYAQNILAGAQRSDDLTSKLLAFSYKGNCEIKPINLHKIIDDVVDILSHSIDKRITIKLNLTDNSSLILGDSTQIQNLLLNLSLNARDSMPGGGELLFDTSTEFLSENYCRSIPYDISPGSFLKIAVSDSGCGIPKENLNKIFEPFYTTKERSKGTGMGLPSVLGTVSNHRGAIEVESIMNEGTTFTIYFPLSEEAEELESFIESNTMTTGEEVVLLVDDDELIRQMGSDFLKGLGYSVHTCNDGREAVGFYKNN